MKSVKAKRTHSLSMKHSLENTKTTMSTSKSYNISKDCEEFEDNMEEVYNNEERHSVIKFQEETSFSVFDANEHNEHNEQDHRPSIRSCFSLMANRSNRPSIFSKFRGASIRF